MVIGGAHKPGVLSIRTMIAGSVALFLPCYTRCLVATGVSFEKLAETITNVHPSRHTRHMGNFHHGVFPAFHSRTRTLSNDLNLGLCFLAAWGIDTFLTCLAKRYFSMTKDILRKHSHVSSFGAIQRDCEDTVRRLQEKLQEEVNSPVSYGGLELLAAAAAASAAVDVTAASFSLRPSFLCKIRPCLPRKQSSTQSDRYSTAVVRTLLHTIFLTREDFLKNGSGIYKFDGV